jgi:hypothetical protein
LYSASELPTIVIAAFCVVVARLAASRFGDGVIASGV